VSAAPDTLPPSPAVSALVRRIAFRLDGALAFNGHPTLSHLERSAWFNLGDASAQLDRIAVLPGMAQHEDRARRDLLELFEVFHPRELEDAADSYDADLAAAEEAHNKQLDARESEAGDAQGCLP